MVRSPTFSMLWSALHKTMKNMIKIKKIHEERLIEWQWSGKLLEEVEKFDQKQKNP